VDGRKLRQFMTRFNELKQTFPIELAAYIIEQSAGALHYAHSYKDKMTGHSLAIVHRDISPQNVLISYEGNVKVIDFGIAKATTNSEATRAGVIKGKPSYLSPEQISGEVLDGRSDIFALGIVLWEMLCGKKLKAGDNDLVVLKLIEACQTHVKPPSTVNPKVPKELDYIVLKALAKQREKLGEQRAKEVAGENRGIDDSILAEFEKSTLGEVRAKVDQVKADVRVMIDLDAQELAKAVVDTLNPLFRQFFDSIRGEFNTTIRQFEAEREQGYNAAG
jgi:serine/threonine-protein kinase